jgi:hypothetical protein
VRNRPPRAPCPRPTPLHRAGLCCVRRCDHHVCAGKSSQVSRTGSSVRGESDIVQVFHRGQR